MRGTGRFTGYAATLLLVGCGGSGSAPGSGAQVRDSAGVEIVENTIEGALGELRAREVLRLGALEGGGPEEFSRIRDLAMDPEGRLFVGNGGSTSVRVFDANGTFVSEFGRRGDGPSEMRVLNQLIVARDTVAVVDWQRNGKALLFLRDGTFLESATLIRPDRMRFFPVHRGPDGWMVSVSDVMSYPRPAPGESALLSQRVHLMEFGADTAGPLLYDVPTQVLHGIPGAQGEGSVDWGLIPERWASGYDAAGRLYLALPWTYRIDVLEPEGMIRSVRRAFEPVPIDDDVVNDIRDAVVHVVDTLEMPEEYRPQQRTSVIDRVDRQLELPLPDIVPPLGALLVSADGSFWVERRDARPPEVSAVEAMWGFGFPATETSWDLYDPEGVYLGSVTLPPRFRAFAVQGRRVAGVWADELDVEYVLKLVAEPVTGD